jgi:ribose 5-phosphate isomerase A
LTSSANRFFEVLNNYLQPKNRLAGVLTSNKAKMTEETQHLKRIAAEHVVDFVESGMIVGLGHGSTAIFAVRKIARMLDEGTLDNIRAVPCSQRVEKEAQRLSIPLTTLSKHPVIDVTIDGADEVTEGLDLIKGGGGALLREKIVAQSSRREIIVIDESKLSPLLGTNFTVPVEVVPFGSRTQAAFLKSIGATVSLRQNGDGSSFKTDQGNYIFDCLFAPIENPRQLAQSLNNRAGIVEHGLFISLATDIIVAGKEGVRHLKKKGRERLKIGRYNLFLL